MDMHVYGITLYRIRSINCQRLSKNQTNLIHQLRGLQVLKSILSLSHHRIEGEKNHGENIYLFFYHWTSTFSLHSSHHLNTKNLRFFHVPKRVYCAVNVAMLTSKGAHFGQCNNS